MRWKYFLVFCALFLLSLPAFSASETEFQVPSLEPEATYEMKGQDIMTLYQTVKDLNELKNDYKNDYKNALTLVQEYESENSQLQQQNQKLTLQNNFLIGTTVCSVGIIVAGAITLVVMNIN